MKTREEQIEQNFQNIKNGSLMFAWDFDPYDTPFIVVAKKENDKIYARIKETNSGVIVLDGYRKQSDAKEERKQAVKAFAEKLRDKEFSVKIGSEWCAVVKSRDIDEFVQEGGVRRMKQIDGEYLVKLQAATIRKFAAEDSDYPDCRAIRANERAIQKWLNKITDNADEQRQILDVIEHGNWNMKDTTFKPIFDELRALGYEVVEVNE